jgi:hypothetical protein
MIKRIFMSLIILMMCPYVYGDSFITMELKYGFYVKDISGVEKTTGNIRPIIILPSIPGSIFGAPSEPVLYTARAKSDNKIIIELPENIDELAQSFEAEGLSISPGGAKILRLGTFHVDPSDPDTIRGGAFVNVETNQFLVLLYVAQATKIEGQLEVGNETFVHDLEFPDAGWHWIEFYKITKDRYVLRKYTGDEANIEFAVMVRKAIAI